MAAGAKMGLKLISVVIGIPVGIVSKKAVERAWLAARPEDPPRKPSEPDVRWTDALGWAALSAAGIVLAELVTQASARATYKAITGSQPPQPKSEKNKSVKDKAD
ncbi:MAG TPA: DUF4235 domain-containing protein [Jatrophihabitans sp.]|nr:DUF4235 domain-containing protein [Jatrophihabitans sp.]